MIIDDDKDEYEVEEITKCVKILGQVFYKIKLMNYDNPETFVGIEIKKDAEGNIMGYVNDSESNPNRHKWLREA